MNKFISQIINIIPPEMAHLIFLEFMKLEILDKKYLSQRLNIKLWNKNFLNPIGLAAGFDKNAEAISGLMKLGFGFLEVGTVTPKKQNGNPKPRVFRIPEYQSIIQRLGFNNSGLDKFLLNMKALEKRSNKILGINIGKNSTTKNYISDYKKLLSSCSPHADYLVLNISSPNTPGLREIQTKKNLRSFLEKIIQHNVKKKPILLKISPDLIKEDLENICEICLEDNFLDGLIVSNTTIKRQMLTDKPIRGSWKIYESGGLSGPPLKKLSNKILGEIYKKTKGKIPLIGVGGITTAEDAYEKISYGASLIQLYTAIVYNGPSVVFKILKGLDCILKQKGFKDIKSAVGNKINF